MLKFYILKSSKQAERGNVLFRDTEVGIKTMFLEKERVRVEDSGALWGERAGRLTREKELQVTDFTMSVLRGSVNSAWVFFFPCVAEVVCYRYSLICIKYCIVIFKRMNWSTLISNSKNKSLLVIRM